MAKSAEPPTRARAERFIEKSVTGIGVMAATAVLQFSGLSTGANANDVSAQTVWLMGAY